MKKWISSVLGIAAAVTLSGLTFAFAQSNPDATQMSATPSSGAMDTTPGSTMGTRRTPAASTTPGMSTTPSYGTGYGSSSGSTYSSTPAAGTGSGSMSTTPSSAMGGSSSSMSGDRPMAKADCGNNGWKNYSSPKFTSQKRCESWVKKNAKSMGTTGTTGTSGTAGSSGSSTSGSSYGTSGSTGSSGARPRTTPGMSATPSMVATPQAH